MRNAIVLVMPFVLLANYPKSLKAQILVIRHQRIKAARSLLLYQQRATIYTA